VTDESVKIAGRRFKVADAELVVFFQWTGYQNVFCADEGAKLWETGAVCLTSDQGNTIRVVSLDKAFPEG